MPTPNPNSFYNSSEAKPSKTAEEILADEVMAELSVLFTQKMTIGQPITFNSDEDMAAMVESTFSQEMRNRVKARLPVEYSEADKNAFISNILQKFKVVLSECFTQHLHQSATAQTSVSK